MNIDEVMSIAHEYSRAWLPATVRDRLRAAITLHVAEAVEAEREACAKVCESLTLEHPGRADRTADQCAAAIRARVGHEVTK